MTHRRDTEYFVESQNNQTRLNQTTLTESLASVQMDNVDVKQAIHQQIRVLNNLNDLHNGDVGQDAFFLCDIGDVVKKWQRWNRNLPMVQPFYAVKCNPNPTVVHLLASLGVNFDCASKQELKMVLDAGVDADRIVYANPCKQQSHIKYAASENISMMTFDNEMELHKVKRLYPGAQMIIRILVDDSKSLCKFGIKYGVDPLKARDLLKVAKELDLDVVGVSFHVGSGCFDASAFYQAVESARKVFDDGEELGFKFNLLDIGGGFPGVDDEAITFEQVADQLKCAFALHFPPECGVRIIAEPGRYFVASAFTSVANITSIRAVKDDQDSDNDGFMYYINDGVYGSFNCIMFDHQYPKAKVLDTDSKSKQLYRSSIWGPTCDSMDCITMDAQLPEMEIGDWLFFPNMGAYTVAAASKFNGYSVPSIVFTCNQLLWERIRTFWQSTSEEENTPEVLTEGVTGQRKCLPVSDNIWNDNSANNIDDKVIGQDFEYEWCKLSVNVERLLSVN
jgi:ornithine decarboxylase